MEAVVTKQRVGGSGADQVGFCHEGQALDAMWALQKQMQGEADRAGVETEDDVSALVAELRRQS